MKKLFTLLVLAASGAIVVNAQSNTATTTQSGSDHLAEITQSGSSNGASLTQSGAEHRGGVQQTGAGNVAETAQSGSANDARMRQNGASNEATITQVGDRNNAANWSNLGINQDGDRNIGSIDQDGAGFVVNGHNAVQNVRGDDNTVTQVQTGDYVPGRFGNHSTVQVGRPFGYADGNTVGTDQSGDHNTLRIQIGGVLGDQSDGNLVQAIQNGSGNMAGIDIVGNDNQSFVNQTGTGNDLRGIVGADWDGISVTGSGNFIDATQDGTGNVATIEITSGAGAFVNNSVTLGQTGSAHQITATIVGDSNTALLMQTGSGNMATATVSGSGNTATVTQN